MTKTDGKRFDVGRLVDDAMRLLGGQEEDERLKRYRNGQVLILVEGVVSDGSTTELEADRQRFREAMAERLKAEGWSFQINCYQDLHVQGRRRQQEETVEADSGENSHTDDESRTDEYWNGVFARAAEQGRGQSAMEIDFHF